MSTLLTLTPKPDVAAVLVEVVRAPSGPLAITRVDDNGTANVRLQENQEPIGGSLTIFDYEAALKGIVSYALIGERINALPNPSFETNTTGWLIVGGQATITRVTTQFQSGIASCQLDTVIGATSPYASSGTTDVAAQPGDIWTGSVYVKGGTGSVEVQVLATDGASTLATYASSSVAVTGAWQRISVTSPALPASTTNVRIRVKQNDVTIARTVYFDSAMLEESASLFDYIEGTVPTTFTGQVTTSVAAPILIAPILPHYRQSLTAVLDYDAEQDTSTTIHWVVDRRDPLVITTPSRFRTGRVEMYAEDYAKAEAIRNVAANGEVLLLRQPDYLGMDMYFIPQRIRTAPKLMNTLPRRWAVELDYVEVKNPSGPVLSGTWNFDEVLAIGTFDAVQALFPTFNDLVAGP